MHERNCAVDSHECIAYRRWQQLRSWKPEQRTRPRPCPTDSVNVGTAKKAIAQRERVSENETVASNRDVNGQAAEPRSALQAIDAEPSLTSASEPIASPSALPEIVTPSDEPIPTFRASRCAHSREYLTTLLRMTGGERRRAAQLAGVGRSHLQSLIKRYDVDVRMNPKARGRRRSV